LKKALAVVMFAALCGCASVQIPFVHQAPEYGKLPTESLKAVALDIERAVQEGNRDAQIADRDGIVVNTDIIRQAIRTRAARSELVNEALDKGYAIEKPNGHLYILRTREYKKETTSRDRDRIAMLVGDEAVNRWAIYEGIADASKLPRRTLSAIQEVFHQARLEVMKDGQKYEGPNGEVIVKGQ